MKKLFTPTLIAAAVACGGFTATVQAEKSMTVVSWGGAYTKSQTRAYHDPWSEKTGTKIQHEDKSGTALAGIRSQVQADNVSWDIVDILEGDA